MAQILAVDDNREILTLIEKNLNKAGHDVTIKTEIDPSDISYLKQFDLIVLDVMLEEASGYDICKMIRPHISSPIVFLTAKTLEENLVTGFFGWWR